MPYQLFARLLKSGDNAFFQKTKEKQQCLDNEKLIYIYVITKILF